MYLRIHGVQSGPLDEGAVRADFRAGRLGADAMSWCAGEARWISLGRRWSVPRPPAGRAIAGMALALLFTLGAEVMFRTQLRVLPFHLQTAGFLWPVMLVLLALTVLGMVVAWRAPRRAKRASLWLVVPTLAVVVGCVRVLAGTAFTGRLLQFRQHAANASVTFDPSQQAIRIGGLLGPRLPDQLRAALQAHPETDLLVLDSPGGLVEDAVHTAQLVHARGLTTRVDGICASACVAIWAAGARHEMTATSRVGIHRAYFLVNLPSVVVHYATVDLTRQYDHFLRQAGFDPDVIRKGNQTPSGDMYWLNPVQVYQAGVDVTILDANGVVASPAMARWLWVAGSHGPDDPFGMLLRAIGKYQPKVAERHAFALYTAEVDSANAAAVHTAANALYTDAKREALARADDAQVIGWSRSLLATFGGSRRYGWTCKVDTSHSGLESLGGHALHVGTAHDLVDLIDGVGPTGSARFVAPRYDADTARVARRAFADARHYGAAIDVSRWQPVDWCTYELSYLGHALALPQHQAADAVRVLELRHWHVH